MSENIFSPTIEQFDYVVSPIGLIGKSLQGFDNVIRPSVAFYLIIDTIKYYIKNEIPEFIVHKETWGEVIDILDKLAIEVGNSKIDTQAAMCLDTFEFDLADSFYIYGRMATVFSGNYKSYVGNRNSDSFGNLTVSEALKLIYFTLNNFAPTSSWSYGYWKDPDPNIRGRWITWPWASYVLSTIRKTYIDLEEVFNFTDPGGSFPWSRG